MLYAKADDKYSLNNNSINGFYDTLYPISGKWYRITANIDDTITGQPDLLGV